MAKRISQYNKNRKGGRLAFLPDMKKWKAICSTAAYDTQIYKYFMINGETFYAFIDRERYKEEQDSTYKSEYLVTYINERQKTKEYISSCFLKNMQAGDTASILFGMKTYNGLIEAKDIAHIELKKKEVALKTKDYLTSLAHKFELNYDQLKDFSKRYFKDIDLE